MPSQTGPMEARMDSALALGAADEEVDDAGAEVETVEDDVDGDHDGDEAEPEGFHLVSEGGGFDERGGAVLDFARYEEKEEQGEDGIEAHEAEEGE